MPRPRVAKFWRERIRELVANDPRLSGAAIRKQLAGFSAPKEAGVVPSDRAIRRIRDEFPDTERDRYKYFTWPGSMQSGIIPWEASHALIAWLRWRTAAHRPFEPALNRHAAWYWRVTQALPDAAVEDRDRIARHYALLEVAEATDETLEYVQWKHIVFRAWERDDKDTKTYNRALTEGRIPECGYHLNLPVTKETLPYIGRPIRFQKTAKKEGGQRGRKRS